MADVRVADLLTFLAVCRTQSITAAARELRVTPSQVSKAVTRLERQAGVRLLARTSRGISLTQAGREMIPRVGAAVAALRELKQPERSPDAPVQLKIAGPSYLVTHMLPAIAMAAPRLRLTGYELAPAYLRAYLTENVYDIALAPGDIEGKPPTWTSDPVGSVRAALIGAPEIAQKLAPLPTTGEKVAEISFIVPSSAPSDRFVPLGDACPLRRDERRIGHELQTIGAALELCAQTRELVVFGPVIAARRFIESGALVEIPVQGWSVGEPLFLVCNGNRVLESTRKAILRALREMLGRPTD